MDTWSRFSITRRGHYDRCPQHPIPNRSRRLTHDCLHDLQPRAVKRWAGHFFFPFDHSRLSPATGQLVLDPFVSESLLRPRNASCAQTGELVTELESREERAEEPVTRPPVCIERMEKPRARGMAPVEREISNLVMDKRLLESQFFVRWHKSSLLLSCIYAFSRFEPG